jgi:two-component system OmpR family response regulator
MILEQHGYRVLVALSGNQALRIARTSHMDAALLDYQLPGMDGVTLARHLRHLKPHLKILLLSGSPAADIPVELFADVDAYVFKAAPPRQWLRELALLIHDARRAA